MQGRKLQAVSPPPRVPNDAPRAKADCWTSHFPGPGLPPNRPGTIEYSRHVGQVNRETLKSQRRAFFVNLTTPFPTSDLLVVRDDTAQLRAADFTHPAMRARLTFYRREVRAAGR